MTMGIAAAPLRATRRITKNLAVAAAIVAGLASPLLASAATNTPPLITIPPAKLPPLPALDATASAEPALIPMPREWLPTGLQVLRDPQGTGLAIYGAVAEKTESATGALLSIFAHSKAFDSAPVSHLVLADESDRRAQALFTATAHGAPVIAVAVAALGDPEDDVSVFYDNAGAFPASFPRLQQALASSAPVEIGISDNSVDEADIAGDGNADANWDEAIAALIKGGETPIDSALAHSLADRLASDTGEKWRIVSPATLR
jgi:hypothetical protein